MKDILAKLEAATGPDRAIDGEIFKAMGGDAWEAAKDMASMPSGAPAHIIDKEARVYAPHYTESVDASLTILPKDRRAAVTTDCEALVASTDSSPYWTDDLGIGFYEKGANPAIAVLVAIIKDQIARLAQTGDLEK